MYKLGFTSLPSVEARLAFQGLGHERLIEEVLLFAYFEDALDIEQELHKHFHPWALFPTEEEDMPLYANGQSELYAEDILKFDPAYTRMQAWKTNEGIGTAAAIKAGASEEKLRELRKYYEESLVTVFSEALDERDKRAPPSTPAGRAFALLKRTFYGIFSAVAKLLKWFSESENSRAADEHFKALMVRLEEARTQPLTEAQHAAMDMERIARSQKLTVLNNETARLEEKNRRRVDG